MARKRPSLSLATIVRDEEANLARSLNSVEDIVDEIIIVDTGSTDRTKEIADSFGAKVIEFDWIDDFSAARNHALEAVTCDWTLHLDADEEIVAGVGQLNDILRDRHMLGYLVVSVVAEDANDLTQIRSSSSAVRLFRNNDQIRYKHPIHEQLTIDEHDRIGRAELLINHFGHLLEDGKDRFGRNLPLLQGAIERDPADGYYWGRLGGEYLYNDRPEEARDALERAVGLGEAGQLWWLAAMRDLAMSLYDLGQPREAVALLQGYERRFPRYTDFFFLHGEIARGTQNPERAAELYRLCLQKGDPPPEAVSWGGVGSWRAQGRLDQLGSSAR